MIQRTRRSLLAITAGGIAGVAGCIAPSSGLSSESHLSLVAVDPENVLGDVSVAVEPDVLDTLRRAASADGAVYVPQDRGYALLNDLAELGRIALDGGAYGVQYGTVHLSKPYLSISRVGPDEVTDDAQVIEYGSLSESARDLFDRARQSGGTYSGDWGDGAGFSDWPRSIDYVRKDGTYYGVATGHGDAQRYELFLRPVSDGTSDVATLSSIGAATTVSLVRRAVRGSISLDTSPELERTVREHDLLALETGLYAPEHSSASSRRLFDLERVPSREVTTDVAVAVVDADLRKRIRTAHQTEDWIDPPSDGLSPLFDLAYLRLSGDTYEVDRSRETGVRLVPSDPPEYAVVASVSVLEPADVPAVVVETEPPNGVRLDDPDPVVRRFVDRYDLLAGTDALYEPRLEPIVGRRQ